MREINDDKSFVVDEDGTIVRNMKCPNVGWICYLKVIIARIAAPNSVIRRVKISNGLHWFLR